MVTRIAWLLANLMFRVMPLLPQLTRWLKTMYAVDWWLLATSFHSFLLFALCHAFGRESGIAMPVPDFAGPDS